MPRSPLARVRAICLALPEATERLSHGAPSFFVGRACFVNYMDNHHGDGRLALWCAAPAGLQRGVVKADPDHYFVPPYVGFRGWIGVRVDHGLSWDDVERAIRDAYLAVAPKALVAVVLSKR
jgi:hypothetical protein